MSLLHSKAEDINCSKRDFYIIIGYLSNTNRIKSIDAEVPVSLGPTFTAQYNSSYLPIADKTTPSGLPSKFGVQYRINLSNINNAPLVLMPYLKVGRAGIVARINKSRFVENLIENFGFKFGSTQNLSNIQSKIPSQYLNDYNHGFNL